jgi:hypothetical protein
MAKYRKVCSNDDCKYQEKFTASFEMKVRDDEICPECSNKMVCVEDSKNIKSPTSAALVSGVGEINKRLPGDFRDMMSRIKRGSPGSKMNDFK